MYEIAAMWTAIACAIAYLFIYN